ncbi:hypothetical protein SAMN05660653_01870 [Desulfonatronum thiosulfatophilum]|uniref:Phosphate transport regulator (Distant homolog of PhoU) n=1 Tax=Desulfonatronum thiosulfatophilum TaxID=617002 RepID=A0A1G6D3B3_9BACT|nr:DUF47 family protein [Desulfonatronum thiosulfatophilum]SDB39435.1 hypothetical protein SAMN05660653_01870 [Desulfonatronum thiosulfatophilum]
MRVRIPFLSMIGGRSPMDGLLEHYSQVEASMTIINESLLCYIGGGSSCKDFQILKQELDHLEERADKIKRNTRNHLPRGVFMSVDKTLFLNYTRAQDNILDSAQDALDWLNIHTVQIPGTLRTGGLTIVEGAIRTVELLKPALEGTIRLLHTDFTDRQAVKESYRAVRSQHNDVRKMKSLLFRELFSADMEFKDVFQLLHFFEYMHEMSHNAEGCADILRAMIAR